MIIIIFGIPLSKSCDWQMLGEGLIICGSIVLFGVLIILLINSFVVKAEITKFEATRQAIIVSRKTEDDFERAAIQHKIIERNEWLAGMVYWNQTIFDIFIPDEVMQLKPLK